ncbi:MAG: ribosomal RNA small subunit methyltransferase A [candidate division Zixibacteria bacterium RBG_16_48_11]|nr:MAG: ribosomal RNA small subunit methyltransferase A [candidate division Zixibacteria bacterium RBG_16_48_11]
MPSAPSGSRPRPKKRFSQNFLVNLGAARRIVEALNLSGSEIVLEIGAGQGVLTQFLAEKAKKTYAVELDRGLASFLTEKFAQAEKVQIISADILKVRLEDYVSLPNKIKIVGNLPYQITSPVLDWIVNQREFIELAVVTVQKEVAQRICAQPGTREWSPLSIFCQVYFRPKILFTLSAGSFFPAPKVQSAVVRLQIVDQLVLKSEDEEPFFELIQRIFSARRKTLLKTLSDKEGLPRNQVEQVLERVGRNSRTRGETLTILELLRLAEGLKQIAR